MPKRISIIVAAVLALGLFATACGGGGTETNGNGGSTTAPATTESPAPDSTETSGEVRIALEDNVFVPATLTVASGAELELDNEGEAPHTFTVDGQSIDVEVAAGENGTATIDLESGTYDFICRFHEAAGMTGTLTVT